MLGGEGPTRRPLLSCLPAFDETGWEPGEPSRCAPPLIPPPPKRNHTLVPLRQAALVRKLRDSDVATQWTLTYALSRQVRVQFNITSAAPYARTLYLQYSSEGAPNAE